MAEILYEKDDKLESDISKNGSNEELAAKNHHDFNAGDQALVSRMPEQVNTEDPTKDLAKIASEENDLKPTLPRARFFLLGLG